ncbi:unnamed protein product [Stenotrophomonas maltophilia]|nr:unnamed protein product [Stenotrophomonas maltophilia]
MAEPVRSKCSMYQLLLSVMGKQSCSEGWSRAGGRGRVAQMPHPDGSARSGWNLSRARARMITNLWAHRRYHAPPFIANKAD